MDAFADSDIGLAVCTWDIGFDPTRVLPMPIADSDRTDIAVAAAAALPATSSTVQYSFSRTSRHRRWTQPE